ncbi:hypothetical protein [Nocardioides sp. KR10-350]|uniref:hypothetical protein n=1 Tax=Nocardioides cheoyonin TaxID=3156615 RepID=UPI0032B315C1
MKNESLESAIARAGSALDLLRNWPARPFTLPIVAEHTDWQSEQRAWRESVVLMDQSHHMNDLFLRGDRAVDLLRDLGVNSFRNFGPGHAKQYVVTNHDGFYIADVVLTHLPDGTLNMVGAKVAMDWVRYHGKVGGYGVEFEFDPNSAAREPGRPPKQYRYEVQGPFAKDLMSKVLGQPVPDVKFFHMVEIEIAGHAVQVLRHGMAGQPGFELFGPWEQGEQVRQALLDAGREFELRQVGSKAYSTANLESGWIPPTVPAIFTGEQSRGFREWLVPTGLGALGGSLSRDTIEDHYLTPYDLGYDKIVSFDHDFVGHEALEKMAAEPPRRRVSLIWESEDVTGTIMGSLFNSRQLPAKLVNLPKARYATYQQDAVLNSGELVGVSMDAGYVANERVFLSLASVDNAHAEPGTQVTVVWGERPVSSKPGVEPHRQVEVRATVAPAPLDAFARDQYRLNRRA